MRGHVLERDILSSNKSHTTSWCKEQSNSIHNGTSSSLNRENNRFSPKCSGSKMHRGQNFPAPECFGPKRKAAQKRVHFETYRRKNADTNIINVKKLGSKRSIPTRLLTPILTLTFTYNSHPPHVPYQCYCKHSWPQIGSGAMQLSSRLWPKWDWPLFPMLGRWVIERGNNFCVTMACRGQLLAEASESAVTWLALATKDLKQGSVPILYDGQCLWNDHFYQLLLYMSDFAL